MELHCSLQNHELGARPPAYLWLCWLWGRGSAELSPPAEKNEKLSFIKSNVKQALNANSKGK